MINELDLKLSPMELMIQAKNGNSESYAALYQELYTPVYRYVFQKTINHEKAEDVTQIVFMKAFQSVEKFCDQGISPLAYFFTIARNTIIDLAKKEKRECILEEDDQTFERIEEPHEIPTKKMNKKEQKIAIQKAMQQLTSEQRDVLTFKFINDLKNPEIAGIMQKEESTIRQIQCRGIKRLKQLSHLKSYI